MLTSLIQSALLWKIDIFEVKLWNLRSWTSYKNIFLKESLFFSFFGSILPSDFLLHCAKTFAVPIKLVFPHPSMKAVYLENLNTRMIVQRSNQSWEEKQLSKSWHCFLFKSNASNSWATFYSHWFPQFVCFISQCFSDPCCLGVGMALWACVACAVTVESKGSVGDTNRGRQGREESRMRRPHSDFSN